MLQIHPNARTTPAVRAEIAGSEEPTGILAQRFGVSTETIRKWRKRGVEDCLDHSARPHQLPWKAPKKNVPWSALCAGPLTSLWMILPSWSRIFCRI
jgi:hypothetical protein